MTAYLDSLLSFADRSSGPDACWPWMRYRNKDGYGRVKRGLVPRLVLAETLGRPVNGDTRHSCDNPPCINPAHLSEGTRAENVADMVVRGRSQAGRTHSVATRRKVAIASATKLTPDDVEAIRASLAAGELGRDIAARYGINHSMVSAIKSGRAWSLL